MAIRAAQVDFADIILEVRTLLNGDALSALNRCGGPRAAFGEAVLGKQEECNVYLTCSNRYLYTDDAEAEGNSQGIVVVTIPAGARSRSCNFVASIVADFSNPLQGPADCDPTTAYECPGERRCVPLSYVCDGIQDCEGNADESGCHQLVPLPDEAFCIDAEFYVNTTVGRWQPMEECKRAAARLGSGLFTLEPTTLNCAVVMPAVIPSILTAPEAFVRPMAGAQTVIAVDYDTRAGFGLCRASVQCSGRGTAIATIAGGCECDCGEGYYGERCEESLQLDRITSIVCVLLVNSTATEANGNIDNGDTNGGEHKQRDLSLVLIADALLLDTAAAQTLVARCSIFAMEMLGRTHVGCTVAPRLGRATNADIAHHYRRLLTPDGQRTVEELLAASAQPPLLYVSAQTAMTPSVITNARCEGSSTAVVDYARTAVVTEKEEEEALCNLTEHARTYSRLQLLVRNSLPVLSVAIAFVGGGFGSDEVGGGGGRGAKGRGREFTEASEAERSANDIIIVECAMMSVNVDGGCVASSCDIPAPSAARASAAPPYFASRM